MTRKRTVSILLLVLTAILCLTFAACDFGSTTSKHTHKYSVEWKQTSTKHWRQCSCGAKLAEEEHDFGNWVEDWEATETARGQKHRTCSVCGHVQTEVIPSLSESHKHQYGTAWQYDDSQHWHECSCGDKTDVASHNWGAWVVDVEAEVGKRGSKHAECTICGHRKTAAIPALDEEHEHVAESDRWYYDETSHWHECACGEQLDSGSHTAASTEWHNNATSHWQECVCGAQVNVGTHVASDWIVESPATSSSAGVKRKECTLCGCVLERGAIPQLVPTTTRTVDFYAINDFHGATDKMSTVGGYLKQQYNNNHNTVLINSGDMFQGSMESNSNYGQLLSQCMVDIGFSCMTFGNHEFDWGLDNLINLSQTSGVPFLGANIYHWNATNKTWGTFASELAKEYEIVTLENGLKVGIIGVIGKDQITSISSQLVQTIGFKDPLPIVQTLATKLRNQEGCDVVVLSAHTGPQSLVGETENDAQPSSVAGLQNYVDAVFCAHTHREQVYTVDGIPFIQGGSYGKFVSRVQLQVAPNGTVSCSINQNIPYSSSWPNLLPVQTRINNSNALIASEANQVLANSNGTLNKNGEAPRMVCRAIADYAAENYSQYPISLAMINVARNNISSGNITYTNLYEAIPFDNTVYIAKVSGADIINEAVNYDNYIWRVDGAAIENSNTKYYYIAVIDYLLFHQNSYRNYDYFKSAFTSGFTPVPLENSNYDAGTYNYRLITRDWLLAQTGRLDVSQFGAYTNNTDTSLLTSTVTINNGNTGGSGSGSGSTSTPAHEGTISDPYTVADAAILAAGITSVSGGATAGYLTATVSSIGSVAYSTRDGSLRGVYVRDSDGNTLQLYWISKYDGATSSDNWTQDNLELHVGDVVVVYGYFIMYNTTVEITQGYCVSINGVPTD